MKLRGLLITACALLLTPSVAAARPATTGSTSLPPVKHVFVVIDENESESTTFGASSQMPYLSKTLVSQGAFVPNYYGIGHASLDNYIAMVSGQAPNSSTSADCGTFTDFPAGAGLNAAGQQTGAGCVYPANVPTLMGQLNAAHLSWRGYMDGMGTDPARESVTCGHPAVGTSDPTQVGESSAPYDEYATRHDPFVYFHGVIDNTAECQAGVVGLGRLTSDLASAATTPNYVFVTPDLCNDGHDEPCHNPSRPGGPAGADAFLQKVVPEITNSPAYKQNGLLIVTFDESAGVTTACCGEQPGPGEALPGGSGPGGGPVGAVLLSRFIKPGTVSQASYNHYGMLGTVEGLFGLSRIGYAAGLPAFGSDVFTNPPLSVAAIRSALRHEPAPAGMPARITTLLHHRRLALRVSGPEAGRLVVKFTALVRRGHRRVRVTLASGAVTFTSPAKRKVTIKLTRQGVALLRPATRLPITVSYAFTSAFSRTAVTSSRAVTLRR